MTLLLGENQFQANRKEVCKIGVRELKALEENQISV